MTYYIEPLEEFWNTAAETRIYFHNKAALEVESYSYERTYTNYIRLNRKFSLKTGEKSGDDGILDWEVTVNGNGGNVDVSKLVLTDTLREGLTLDLDSVRLERYRPPSAYTTSSSTSPAYASGTYIDELPITIENIDYRPEENSFTFIFPDNCQGNYVYKVCFSTYASKTGTYENEVRISGDHVEYTRKSNSIYYSKTGGTAGGIPGNRWGLIMLKEDNLGTGTLAGAKFELYNKFLSKVAQGETDSSGEILFNSSGEPYKFVYGAEYYLRETQAPSGYDLPKGDLAICVTG